MKRMLKKGLALFSAAALTLGALGIPAISANAADSCTATLNTNTADWSASMESESVEVTGDGEYTIKATYDGEFELGDFNALEIADGETTFGRVYTVTITSIKADGKEIMEGDSYTCSADGGAVTTRVNIYNSWNDPNEDISKDGYQDCRCAEGSVLDCTARLVPQATTCSELEVTFVVANAFEEGTPVDTSSEAEVFEGDVFARLNTNTADWSAQMESEEVLIEGDGEYTIKATSADDFELGDFNALEIENGELKFGRIYTVTITSIKADGEEVMEGSSYTCSADGAAVTTRVNIYNSWNDPNEDISGDGFADCRCADGSVLDCTARLVPQATTCKELEVTFVVENAGDFGTAAEVDNTTAEVDLDGEYHAYIGLQSPTYSFRNEWFEPNYGMATEYFNQVTGWDADNNAVVRAGEFTDVTIAGNGTYTVKATGLDLEGDFDAQECMNLIFFSTDIPYTDAITFSDIKLLVNGMEVSLSTVKIPDENVDYISVQLQNAWDADIKEIGYYPVPVTDIEITFTVSGFNYDAEVVAAVEETTPDEAAPVEEENKEEGKKGLSTGALAGIIGGGVVVVGGGIAAGVTASKKKKED
ncbi:MAG: hypothetical protein MJ105_04205 [Lachnospiraceae bacterium]|nr:hypothetical protein [Lachnospiraceae bacterium]